AELERMGERRVRLALERKEFPDAQVHTAYKWLSEKDDASARVKDASQAEQIEIARSARDAAWAAASAAERAAAAAEKANERATIALIIAAISITVTTIISLWLAH